MKCYASIGEINEDKGITRCEITSIDSKETIDGEMIFIELNMIREICEQIEEGDIFTVEVESDDTNKVTCVYCKDDAEKQRRIAELEEIMNS